MSQSTRPARGSSFSWNVALDKSSFTAYLSTLQDLRCHLLIHHDKLRVLYPHGAESTDIRYRYTPSQWPLPQQKSRSQRCRALQTLLHVEIIFPKLYKNRGVGAKLRKTNIGQRADVAPIPEGSNPGTKASAPKLEYCEITLQIQTLEYVLSACESRLGMGAVDGRRQ